jgi:hypothetical protein
LHAEQHQGGQTIRSQNAKRQQQLQQKQQHPEQPSARGREPGGSLQCQSPFAAPGAEVGGAGWHAAGDAVGTCAPSPFSSTSQSQNAHYVQSTASALPCSQEATAVTSPCISAGPHGPTGGSNSGRDAETTAHISAAHEPGMLTQQQAALGAAAGTRGRDANMDPNDRERMQKLLRQQQYKVGTCYEQPCTAFVIFSPLRRMVGTLPHAFLDDPCELLILSWCWQHI